MNLIVKITAFFVTIGLAFSHVESIEPIAIKLLDKFGVTFVFVHFRDLIILLTLVALILSMLPSNWMLKTLKELRKGWLSKPHLVGLRVVYIEEIALALGAVLLVSGVLFGSYAHLKFSFANFGLNYLATESCDGNHAVVVSRSKILLDDQLWRRYWERIEKAEARSIHLSNWQKSFESYHKANFNTFSNERRSDVIYEWQHFFGKESIERLPLSEEDKLKSVVTGNTPNC
ncbi:hypothetical protein [Pseudovibrio brasiliensis]|uniref:FtsX-like permease family protein n=1 Tax=Pseudovibrio brasiliensis TaxID=1898042 RepID=A0ABX8ALA0_9HYPH|nr:hypothetical protein [Pseudovibrio brasiliensis]QUS54481.1 hypothetical protein KGB56_13885 [Pseudovibrio brasiliensis]